MADSTILPGVRARLVAPDGTTTREFYRFFSALSVAASLPGRVDDLTVRVDDLDVRVTELEHGGGAVRTIQGLQSVKVVGPLEDGSVKLALDGDVISAPALSFYGALAEYGKGWQTFSGNFAALDNGDDTQSLDLADIADTGTGTLQAITVDTKGRVTGTRPATITGTDGRITVAHGDASDGLPTLDLATVADAGGGALLRFVRDAWGRLTGTSAATTTDLPEGDNLYYTDTRADARITVAKADPDGIASLVSGKLDTGQLPALAITETFVVASQAAMLALTAEEGDVAVRTDLSQSFILTASPASTLANWQELLTPASPVTSVFGRVGSVTAASGDYTFAQIGSKPTTLSGYGITDAEPAFAAGTTAQYRRGDKTWQTLNKVAVGLGNVDNTSDVNKPVSTAQQAAIAGKLGLTGGTLSANAGAVPAPQSDTVLQVVGADGHPARVEIDAFGSFPVFQCRAASGTASAPTPVGNGAPIAGFAGAGWDGSAWTTARGNFNIQADGAWSETNNGTFLRVNLTRSGATSQVAAYDMRTDMFIPGTSNYISNGGPANLWSVVYAATGAINTSDAREKTAVTPLTDAELAAAADLARAIGTYQWLASIADKSADNARHHAGLTVQRAIEIMQSHGLDPMRYGFICYDEWHETPEQWADIPEEHDDEGNVIREAGRELVQAYRPAGDRYSFRTDELDLWISRGLIQLADEHRAEIDAMKRRLDALEAK